MGLPPFPEIVFEKQVEFRMKQEEHHGKLYFDFWQIGNEAVALVKSGVFIMLVAAGVMLLLVHFLHEQVAP